MVYICGCKWDYDNWVVMGVIGWVYEDVLLYFKCVEYNECGSDFFYGIGGLLNVMDQYYLYLGSVEFVEVVVLL